MIPLTAPAALVAGVRRERYPALEWICRREQRGRPDDSRPRRFG
jgi:hypothetical protein